MKFENFLVFRGHIVEFVTVIYLAYKLLCFHTFLGNSKVGKEPRVKTLCLPGTAHPILKALSGRTQRHALSRQRCKEKRITLNGNRANNRRRRFKIDFTMLKLISINYNTKIDLII